MLEYFQMSTSKDESGDAARLAAESVERFRSAAARERESRDAPTEERLRVLTEAIEEEGEAIEQFHEAVELRRRIADEEK